MMIEIKFLIYSLLFINLVKSDIPDECKQIPELTKDSHKLCCDLPGIFTSDETNIAMNKTIGYIEKHNVSISRRNNRLINCIFDKFVFETVDLLTDDRFDLEKFYTLAENDTDLENFTDILKSSSSKCSNLTTVMDVKGMQFEKVHVKPEDCNYESTFMRNCIEAHYFSVSRYPICCQHK